MKIIASRLDDVLNERREYESRRKAYQDAQEESYSRFRRDRRAITRVIQEYLEQDLAQFNALDFVVSVGSTFNDDIEVHIRCNESNKFAKTSALSWSYEAVLHKKTGEVESETSSWSGLKATTPAQLDSLRQTVEALEYLNNVDWAMLLDVQLPDYDERYTKDLPEAVPSKSFDMDITDAALEEIVGQNKAIRVYNYEGSDYSSRVRTLWMMVERATPSRYVASFSSGNYDEDQASLRFAEDVRNGWFRQVSKIKIHVVFPVEIIDVDTNASPTS